MLRGALHLRLSFLTIAALVVGALAACGGDDDGSGSGISGEASGTSSASDGSTSASEATSSSSSDASSGGGSSGGDTGGVDPCDQSPPDPTACGADDKGALHCTSTDKECPGSLHECDEGGWQAVDLDATCVMLGHDFAFGCVDDAGVGGILTVCGNGPGTACEPDTAPACMGDATLLTCSLGKMSARDCQATCEDMGEDHGACSSEGGAAACVCCSKGDPGCPV
ncbi:MAG: hypothetical protein H6710_13420 [Myxococcales bacterium]|nr:hypothetical protein [Myxococcales bacterium]